MGVKVCRGLRGIMKARVRPSFQGRASRCTAHAVGDVPPHESVTVCRNRLPGATPARLKTDFFFFECRLSQTQSTFC